MPSSAELAPAPDSFLNRDCSPKTPDTSRYTIINAEFKNYAVLYDANLESNIVSITESSLEGGEGVPILSLI